VNTCSRSFALYYNILKTKILSIEAFPLDRMTQGAGDVEKQIEEENTEFHTF